MSVLAEGFFFLGGLKLYILNKIKDARYLISGEKNNTLLPYNRLAQVKGRNYLNSNLIKLRSFNNYNNLCFAAPSSKTFHTKVRASNRIGPHNEEVVSVIIGSLLGDVNPNWITGFTDAEGSFIISVIASKDRAIGWRVTPIFSIKLGDSDLDLLKKIQSFFGVGNITFSKSNGQAIYSVKSTSAISSVIIPHFVKYPLITQKRADYILFKNIVDLILQREHLELKGLKKILELRASLNKGLSTELTKAFTDIKPVIRPIVKLPEKLDINWFIGFVDGEGSFFINISKRKSSTGYSTQLNFNLTQHIRDALLFKFIQEWLGCGNIYEISKDSRVNLVISKLEDINNVLIPKLDKYPLKGIKRLNYEDFKLAAELIKNKEHLTLDGLNKLKEIKSRMNTKRKIFNSEVAENKEMENKEMESKLTSTHKKSILITSINKTQKRTFHTSVRAINRIGPHNEEIVSVIVGSLLGNTRANARTIEGTRICYRQSDKHMDYLFWLYDFFYTRAYCSNLKPRKYTRKLKDIEYYSYEFNTFTFRSFNWIHKLFYKKGKKYISPQLEQYLTPLALAIWIMDDGCWANSGVRIATNCFELEEVKLLVNILTKLYNLNCTVQKIEGRYSIYITKESIPKLRNILLPYILPSMRYKLGLNDRKQV